MAETKKIFQNYDFTRNQIRNAAIHNAAEAPGLAVEGMFYYNTTDKLVYYHNGTEWVPFVVGGNLQSTASVTINYDPVTHTSSASVVDNYIIDLINLHSPVTTADNGLTKTGNNIQLGGDILADIDLYGYGYKLKGYDLSEFSMRTYDVGLGTATGIYAGGQFTTLSSSKDGYHAQISTYNNNVSLPEGIYAEMSFDDTVNGQQAFFRVGNTVIRIHPKNTAQALQIDNLPTGVSSDDVLLITATNQVKRIAASGLIPNITADNGLTKTGNNIQLGGPLTGPVNFTNVTSTNKFTFSGYTYNTAQVHITDGTSSTANGLLTLRKDINSADEYLYLIGGGPSIRMRNAEGGTLLNVTWAGATATNHYINGSQAGDQVMINYLGSFIIAANANNRAFQIDFKVDKTNGNTILGNANDNGLGKLQVNGSIQSNSLTGTGDRIVMANSQGVMFPQSTSTVLGNASQNGGNFIWNQYTSAQTAQGWINGMMRAGSIYSDGGATFNATVNIATSNGYELNFTGTLGANIYASNSNIHLLAGGTNLVHIGGQEVNSQVKIGGTAYTLDVAGTGRFTGDVTVASVINFATGSVNLATGTGVFNIKQEGVTSFNNSTNTQTSSTPFQVGHKDGERYVRIPTSANAPFYSGGMPAGLMYYNTTVGKYKGIIGTTEKNFLMEGDVTAQNGLNMTNGPIELGGGMKRGTTITTASNGWGAGGTQYSLTISSNFGTWNEVGFRANTGAEEGSFTIQSMNNNAAPPARPLLNILAYNGTGDFIGGSQYGLYTEVRNQTYGSNYAGKFVSKLRTIAAVNGGGVGIGVHAELVMDGDGNNGKGYALYAKATSTSTGTGNIPYAIYSDGGVNYFKQGAAFDLKETGAAWGSWADNMVYRLQGGAWLTVGNKQSATSTFHYRYYNEVDGQQGAVYIQARANGGTSAAAPVYWIAPDHNGTAWAIGRPIVQILNTVWRQKEVQGYGQYAAFEHNGPARFDGTAYASSGAGRGMYFNHTVHATANNNAVVGLDINPTLTTGTDVATLGTITGGSGYVDGTYNNVPLTGGFGNGATANIVVSGGAVTSVTMVNRGQFYAAGNNLSAAAANLGGTGSGFNVQVATVGSFTGILKYGLRVQSGDVLISALAGTGTRIVGATSTGVLTTTGVAQNGVNTTNGPVELGGTLIRDTQIDAGSSGAHKIFQIQSWEQYNGFRAKLFRTSKNHSFQIVGSASSSGWGMQIGNFDIDGNATTGGQMTQGIIHRQVGGTSAAGFETYSTTSADSPYNGKYAIGVKSVVESFNNTTFQPIVQAIYAKATLTGTGAQGDVYAIYSDGGLNYFKDKVLVGYTASQGNYLMQVNGAAYINTTLTTGNSTQQGSVTINGTASLDAWTLYNKAGSLVGAVGYKVVDNAISLWVNGSDRLLAYADGTIKVPNLNDSTGVAKMVTVTNGVFGYQALSPTYVPTSSSDTAGNVGDETFDGTYFYKKTATGWVRSAAYTTF